MKTVNKIAAFLMVGVIIFVVTKKYVFDSNKLDSNYRFAIATVYRISYPVDGGPDADFQFCVNQVIYKDFISFNSEKQKILVGNKFVLKYYPSNPKVAKVFLDKLLDSVMILKMGLKTCAGNKQLR